MKNLKYFIVLFIYTLSSCNLDDDLTKPPLDTYTENTIWADVNLATAYVNDIYNVLPTLQNTCWIDGSLSSRTWGTSGASSEAYSNFNYYNEYVINQGTLTPDNIGGFDIWGSTYKYIQNCNVALVGVDKLGAAGSKLKGEILFLRAYAYFKLIRDYGGVPLISAPSSLTSDFTTQKRETFDNCVAFILKDVAAASALLPTSYKTGDANYGRVTKGAAMALKATLLLYYASPQWNPSNDKSRWQNASDAAWDIMQLPDFQLFQPTANNPLTQLFVTLNNEIIYARLTSAKFQWGGSLIIPEMMNAPSGYQGWSAYQPSQMLVDAFGMKNGKEITDPTSGYDPLHPYKNRDPRFASSIIWDGKPYGNPAFYPERRNSSNIVENWEGGIDSHQGFTGSDNASDTRYNFRKWQDTVSVHINTGTPMTNHPTILWRLTEMYLNYAECQYNLGNTAVAIEYLDKIRDRVGIPRGALVGLSGTALLKKIQNERFVELCEEGHRYYDVRRWKIAETTEGQDCHGVKITKNPDGSKKYEDIIVQKRSFPAQQYLLPIPRTEIQRAPQLQQNPGYN